MSKFECKKCMKEYKSYQSLWNHNNRYHYVNKLLKKEIMCQHCTKVFNHKSSLYRHNLKCKLIEKPAEVNQCDKCYYEFKNKQGYDRHKCKIINFNGNNNNGIVGGNNNT